MTNRFFEISSPRDMLGKAKRDFATMNSRLNVDTIFNFFVTAYHVMDYVKLQNKASPEAIDNFYEDEDFKMCQYICNKGKHLRLREGDAYQTQHRKAAVFGQVAFNEVTFNQTERFILIAGGKEVDIMTLAQKLLAKWEIFFKDNDI